MPELTKQDAAEYVEATPELNAEQTPQACSERRVSEIIYIILDIFSVPKLIERPWFPFPITFGLSGRELVKRLRQKVRRENTTGRPRKVEFHWKRKDKII